MWVSRGRWGAAPRLPAGALPRPGGAFAHPKSGRGEKGSGIRQVIGHEGREPAGAAELSEDEICLRRPHQPPRDRALKRNLSGNARASPPRPAPAASEDSSFPHARWCERTESGNTPAAQNFNSRTAREGLSTGREIPSLKTVKEGFKLTKGGPDWAAGCTGVNALAQWVPPWSPLFSVFITPSPTPSKKWRGR